MQHFIQANGNPIPSEISIKSISIEDRIGIRSDSISISIPYSPDIEFPKINATLDVSLGLDYLLNIGTFIVNELTLTGTPLILSIRGNGINKELVSESFSAIKSRTWQAGTKLGAILNEIATNHNLTLITLQSISDIVMPYTFQKAESDASLLYRITSDRDLVIKFGNGNMGVVQRDAQTTASGEVLPPLQVEYSEILNFKCATRTSQTFGTVTAKYQDNVRGSVFTVEEGDGEPRQILKDIYADETTARLAAISNLNASRRKNKSLSFDMLPRSTGVVTGQRLIPLNFPVPITDEFIISNVTHNYSTRYTLSVTSSVKGS